MATLVAVKFPTVEGTEQALAEPQKQQRIRVRDLVGGGAMGGMFWRMPFSVRPLGAAVGAGGGALTDALPDVGIDDRFISDVKALLTPGTSARFVLANDAVFDRVAEAFRGPQADIISTSLHREQKAPLREVLGGGLPRWAPEALVASGV